MHRYYKQVQFSHKEKLLNEKKNVIINMNRFNTIPKKKHSSCLMLITCTNYNGQINKTRLHLEHIDHSIVQKVFFILEKHNIGLGMTRAFI